MPSLGNARSHWPVVAWIRLTLPPPEAPMMLMGGSPPPPAPPLDLLERSPVTTDPRKRVYAYEAPGPGDAIVRLIWDADDPTVLEAELRAPYHDRRLPKEEVPKFWAAVKTLIAPLGPLPVEAADPRA